MPAEERAWRKERFTQALQMMAPEKKENKLMTDSQHQYAVYHARDPWAMIEPREDRWLVNRDQHYRHVALVDAPLERVFALTNHVDEQGWTYNPEIVWHATDAPLRSTSVGDVILCRQTNQAWLVMPVGFKEIIL